MSRPARRAARRPARWLCACALAAGALAGPLGGTAAAEQPADYDPYSMAWNGMAKFVGLAEGMGFQVTAVSSLEWGELSASEVLVLVYPLQRVDPARLGAFVQAGGNVIIADDFGEGKDAMQSLGLLRAETALPTARRYEANQSWAPVAIGRPDHPIGKDVGEVVTNHPAALTHVDGATPVAVFDNGAVAVAGERGSGRFVAVSDPSIFINRMLLYPGNVVLATNMLKWLDRGGHAKHVVLLRGDVPMYGEPRPFIDDARAGQLGRSVADLNFWLSERRAWLLTPAAMKALAAVLAGLLLLLALLALPVRRGPKIDGAWLRFGRPARRDEPYGLIAAADRGAGPGGRGDPGARLPRGDEALVVACVLRDQVQLLLAEVTGKLEPLYTLPEPQLLGEVTAARGASAGAALARVYRRLRALPSRGQAAAPWGAGYLSRRDFDLLYRDVAALCRTLGSELPDDQTLSAMTAPISAQTSRAPQSRPPA